MDSIQCLGPHRWSAVVDGEPLGIFRTRTLAQQASVRVRETRDRRLSARRNALVLTASVSGVVLAASVLPPLAAVIPVTAGAYGIWRGFAGMESAFTDQAWLHRNQIYQ